MDLRIMEVCIAKILNIFRTAGRCDMDEEESKLFLDFWNDASLQADSANAGTPASPSWIAEMPRDRDKTFPRTCQAFALTCVAEEPALALCCVSMLTFFWIRARAIRRFFPSQWQHSCTSASWQT